MTLNVDDIKDSDFQEIGKIQLAIEQYELDLSLLNSMWFDIQTIGVGNGSVSQAPFDIIFNTQNYLKQAGQPYHPKIAAATSSFVNPLYTDTAFKYVIDQDKYDASKPNANTKTLVDKGQILIKGLPASKDDILKMANTIFGDVPTIDLTVPNLSALYRHIMLAPSLNITTDQYILLLKLTGNTQAGDSNLIKALFDRDSLLNVLKTWGKIQASGFSVYDLDYMINQTSSDDISPYVNSGYNTSSISTFLDTVRKVLQGAVYALNAFAFNKLTSSESEQVFTRLTSLGFIDTNGLIIKESSHNNQDWDTIFIGNYIQPDSFTVNNSTVTISDEDSGQIFLALVDQKFLTEVD